MIDTAAVFISCLLLIYVAYRAAKLDARQRRGESVTEATPRGDKRFKPHPNTEIADGRNER